MINSFFGGFSNCSGRISEPFNNNCGRCPETFFNNCGQGFPVPIVGPVGPRGVTGATGATGAPGVPGFSTLSGYQLQLEDNCGRKSVEDGCNVLFDKAVNISSQNISYNHQKGVFTALKSGTYLISWWIDIENGRHDKCEDGKHNDIVEFDLEIVGGIPCKVVSDAEEGVKQLNGSAVVCLTAGACFSLVNESRECIKYGDVPVKANITILTV